MEKEEIDYETRNELFRKYITPHLDFIQKICVFRARSPGDVEEIFNEVLTVLLKGINTYDPSLPSKPWIGTVARNHIHKKYSGCRFEINEYIDVEKIPANLLYYEWDLDSHGQEELSPTMQAAIEMLKPAQKAAVILMLQEYSIEDIASKLYANALIKSPNKDTAKSVLYKAKLKLAKMVDREGNLLVPIPRNPRVPRPARLAIPENTILTQENKNDMAKLKSEIDKYVSLHEKEYFELIENQLLLNALKTAGIEDLPIYKAANAILCNARIEVHLKPIQKHYR